MKNSRRAIAAFIAGGILIMSLFGCGAENKKIDAKPGELLVDCYRATVATVGGDGCVEMTLTSSDDPSAVILDVYTKEADEEEKHETFTVPYEAASRCFAAIEEEGLAAWHERDDLVSINGAKYVCKFRTESGSYIRVSSEEMPEDGVRSLTRISSILAEYVP